MSVNPQLIYQSLLAETDREAKQEYVEVDPRVVLYGTRNTESNKDVQVYANRNASEYADNADLREDNTEQDTLGLLAKEEPNMLESKTIVIVDTAQRDWTIQPDSFTNIFSFINPTTESSSQKPYYYNNSNIPFASYDMPDPTSGYYITNTANYIANNKTKVVDPTTGGIITVNQQFGNNSVLAQTWGWRLVINGVNGQLKHYDSNDSTTFIQPNDRVVYYPVFDGKQSRGQLIGTDPVIQALNKTGFSTQTAITNVKSMKIARATLPLRRFDSYDSYIFGDASQNFTAGTVLNTFHSEPYILMSINNLNGQYYGADPVIHNSFTALVQQQRAVLDTTNSSYFAQYQDYYPWSDESYVFNPPLGQLSNAAMSLSNSTGQAYGHLDDINITTLFFGDIAGNSQPGKISFLITRDRTNPVINISDSMSYCNWFFASNDVRPGDQLKFYGSTINQIQNDPSCTPAISNLFNYLQTNGVVVTKVSLINNDFIPILDVAYTFEAIVNMRNVDEIYAYYRDCINPILTDSNIPSLINISGELSQFNNQKYISLVASNKIISSRLGTLVFQDALSSKAYYPLPTLNRNVQATYAFEIVTVDADTSTLKKKRY
jgi:hypothetical protein